jgi:hypothetical protein
MVYNKENPILKKINSKKDKYIARVKNNQKGLKQNVIENIKTYKNPIDSYFFEDTQLSCSKKYVKSWNEYMVS